MTDDEIYKLFQFRCVVCWHRAQEIHHVLLRSRSKKDIENWKNKVPLCRECHDKIHKNGMTDDKVEEIRIVRSTFLSTIGKSEYI